MLQDVWREHSESDRGDVIEMGESTSGDGHGQKHGAVRCVDTSRSVLCYDLWERRDVLVKGMKYQMVTSCDENGGTRLSCINRISVQRHIIGSYKLLAARPLQTVKYDE